MMSFLDRFRQRTAETREAGGFTEAVTTALQAAATGQGGQHRVQAIAALEAAASLYSRCFAGATILPKSNVTAGLTAPVLGLIARDLLRRGESVWEISVRGEKVLLTSSGCVGRSRWP